MFIDTNAYVGHWPFRNLEHNTLEGLDALAQDNCITHMVISNIEGFFFKDANRANLTLLKKLKAYTGKTVFLPLGIRVITADDYDSSDTVFFAYFCNYSKLFFCF